MVGRLNYSNLAQSTFSEPQAGIFGNTASAFDRHNSDCCSSHISYHWEFEDTIYYINGGYSGNLGGGGIYCGHMTGVTSIDRVSS